MPTLFPHAQHETAEDRARFFLREAGLSVEERQWRALPAAARRRLGEHAVTEPTNTRRLLDLARWLLSTFPPGWNVSSD